MTIVPVNAFENEGGILNARHVRLALDIDRYAERAGIEPHYIWTPARTTLEQEEIAYLVHLGKHSRDGQVGLVYEGAVDVTHRMSIMAGALIRAFIDARVMAASQVENHVMYGEYPEATVLFIPNFFSDSDFGKFDSKRVAALADLLFQRSARGEQTVISVDSITSAAAKLGGKVGSIMNRMFHVGAIPCPN
jgi:hypothetical protein